MGLAVNQVLTAVSAVDAPQIANTVNELSLLGPGAVCTFSAGTLGEGSTLALRMFGKFSNRANAPGTFTLAAKLGDALVWSSGALALPAALHTDITFWLDVLLVMRAGGANAKIMGCGLLQVILGNQSDFLLPSSNPQDSATFDADVDRDLDITAKFSVADPGNKIQLLGYQVLA